jgi:indolepyruvate ferredoxin oxidoreductase beta subunit
METKTIVLCGVGGQGTILAADILAYAAKLSGLEVKVSEIHGMAQRGGAVSTVVRMGSRVDSMVSDPGRADVVVAFETTEALRNLPQLKTGGHMLVNDVAIKPLPVLTGGARMPEHPQDILNKVGATLILADHLALKAGNAKCSNVVLVGALASKLGIDKAHWKEAIYSRVPEKTIEANMKAFEAGYKAAQEA